MLFGSGFLKAAPSYRLTEAAFLAQDLRLSNAKYVLIGEDHGTVEVPEFTEAVCDVLVPQGLAVYAIEAGPLAAETVSASLKRTDRIQQEAALQARYVDSVAFLNLKNENDLAAHCQAASKGNLELWGLDQEFMGSAGLILDGILKTRPSPAVTAEIEKLKQENEAATAKAIRSGDPSQLMLMTVADVELEHAKMLITQGGNLEAQRLIEQMIESHQIYVKDSKGLPDSNRQRALLMKSNLEYDLHHAPITSGAGKILLKFGDWHLYKGFNPIRQLDLGNFVSEMADGQGRSTLHIIILGARGAHLVYAGYGKPYEPQQFELMKDDSYRFMKPFIENQLGKTWTLYDLRRLRFTQLGKLDEETARLIYGYDLLVLIPEVHPATQIR